MKKITIFVLLILLLTSCNEKAPSEGNYNKMENQYALNNNMLYYIFEDTRLNAYDVGTQSSTEISELTGKIYKTPCNIIYVCGNDVYLIEGYNLTKWKTLPEDTVYAASDEKGCYSVKYLDEMCQIFYTEIDSEGPICSIETPDNGESFSLYPTDNYLYCNNGTGIYLLNISDDLNKDHIFLGELNDVFDCYAGKKGLIVLESVNSKVSAEHLVCNIHYVVGDNDTIVGENLGVSEAAYNDGVFFFSGEECYTFNENDLSLTKSSISPTKYVHHKLEYNGSYVIGLIGDSDRFFLQTSDESTTIDIK